MKPLQLEEDILRQMEVLGWRRAVLPKSRFPRLEAESIAIDYSGWPLYTSASLPDEMAYKACAAIAARVDEIAWDESSFKGLDQLGRDTEETPLDVPAAPRRGHMVSGAGVSGISRRDSLSSALMA